MYAQRWPQNRAVLLAGPLVLVMALYWLYPSSHIPTGDSQQSRFLSRPASSSMTMPKHPLRRKIILATVFGGHQDVWLTVGKTMADVYGDAVDMKVYLPLPLNYGFQDIVDQMGLVRGEMKWPDDMMKTLTQRDEVTGSMVDLLLLGTCEIDLPHWHDELLRIWDERPADQKFKLVCGIHNFGDTIWQSRISAWSQRGALRLLPLGRHVGQAFRRKFESDADLGDPASFGAFYEYVEIDYHVPLLDLPEYGTRPSGKKLTRAMIQGSFAKDRRDYDGIFGGLIEALEYDATMWGYQPRSHHTGGTSRSYEPLPGETEPFTLHCVGNGELDIPEELQNIVFKHKGLDYTSFYALTQTMDVVIPAFVSALGNDMYTTHVASSTMAMAAQNGVPLLVTVPMREAYGYLDDDRAVITRPQALREIEAIRLLRAGTLDHVGPPFSVMKGSNATQPPAAFVAELQAMLGNGIYRSQRGFKAFKQQVWQKNREAVARILSDLPGEL